MKSSHAENADSCDDILLLLQQSTILFQAICTMPSILVQLLRKLPGPEVLGDEYQ